MARNLCLLAIAALAGNALAGPAHAQTVGVAAAVVNDVKVSTATAPQPRAVVVRQQMALADRIQTGRNSHLQIQFLDRTTFMVGANARLTIDRFIYDPARGRDFTSSVAKGAFRFLSGQRSPRRNSEVLTPIASIGIRGTVVEGVVGEEALALARSEKIADGKSCADPERATLVVLRGPGAQTQAGLEPGLAEVRASGQNISLDRPSMAVYVGAADCAPIGPFTLSRNGLKRVQELIFPALGQWRRNHPDGRFRDRNNRMGGFDDPQGIDFQF